MPTSAGFDASTNATAKRTIHIIGVTETYTMTWFMCDDCRNKVGTGRIGAVHIPGTPTGPDAGSWMLAYIGFNVNRPFTAIDIIALNYIY